MLIHVGLFVSVSVGHSSYMYTVYIHTYRPINILYRSAIYGFGLKGIFSECAGIIFPTGHNVHFVNI